MWPPVWKQLTTYSSILRLRVQSKKTTGDQSGTAGNITDVRDVRGGGGKGPIVNIKTTRRSWQRRLLLLPIFFVSLLRDQKPIHPVPCSLHCLCMYNPCIFLWKCLRSSANYKRMRQRRRRRRRRDRILFSLLLGSGSGAFVRALAETSEAFQSADE